MTGGDRTACSLPHSKIFSHRRSGNGGDGRRCQDPERIGRSKGDRRLRCSPLKAHEHDGHCNANDRCPSAKGLVLTNGGVCCYLFPSFLLAIWSLKCPQGAILSLTH